MGISFAYEPVVNGVWGFGHGKACDEKGRFVGHLPGLTDDDETLDPRDQRFANEDNLWNQVPSSVYSDAPADGYEPDYSDGYVSRYARLTDEEKTLASELWLDPWDTSREELTRLWCERKYSEYFPTEDVTHESISAEEAEIYSFCLDKWEFFHPELSDDEDETVGSTFQSGSSELRESSKSVLNQYALWFYTNADIRAERKMHRRTTRGTDGEQHARYTYTSNSAGRHGRGNTSVKQMEREARREIQKNNRTVEGRQQIAAENDWMSANYWSADMADFDGQMTFWTKHPEGQTADYYRRLLAVNHINQELKSEWLDAYGEWDEWLELDEIYRADTTREDAYRWGEYAVRPTYDWLMDTYTHPKNLSIHGWHYLDLPYREQHHFLEREREEERLREMEDDRQDWLHRRFMASIYGHPFDDFDDYVGPSLRDDFDEEEERREQDDRDYQAMVDAEADGWNEIDFMEHERQLDAMDEAATLSQHGGPRGWKAGKVANLRLAEFA